MNIISDVKDITQKRLEICRSCLNLKIEKNKEKCGICGCPIQRRVLWTCPDKRW